MRWSLTWPRRMCHSSVGFSGVSELELELELEVAGPLEAAAVVVGAGAAGAWVACSAVCAEVGSPPPLFPSCWLLDAAAAAGSSSPRCLSTKSLPRRMASHTNGPMDPSACETLIVARSEPK